MAAVLTAAHFMYPAPRFYLHNVAIDLYDTVVGCPVYVCLAPLIHLSHLKRVGERAATRALAPYSAGHLLPRRLSLLPLLPIGLQPTVYPEYTPTLVCCMKVIVGNLKTSSKFRRETFSSSFSICRPRLE